MIKELRGVSFKWKETDKPSMGLIAQEVEKVLPELVYGVSEKSIVYGGIVPILIQAIKENSVIIDEIKEKIMEKK